MSSPIDQTIEVFHQSEAQVSSQNDRKLITMQLRALEHIRKCVQQYGAMRYQIESFEKLISDPWMENQSVFEINYAAWRNFRDSYAREIGAMTVNERLCFMGLMDDFEKSVECSDSRHSILRAAFLSPSNIEAILTNKRKRS